MALFTFVIEISTPLRSFTTLSLLINSKDLIRMVVHVLTSTFDKAGVEEEIPIVVNLL